MIQDIYPHQFNNDYQNHKVSNEDYVFVYFANQILLHDTGTTKLIPTFSELKKADAELEQKCYYLFSIDKVRFFLGMDCKIAETDELIYSDMQILRTFEPTWLAFAAITGAQLFRWYHNHQFCGRCGGIMQHSEKERSLYCSNCGNVVYPKLSPAIIVGITDGDKILLTRYANSNIGHYALVAGYAEVGETLEETVAREVMEEVGLKIKDITYYKSQPWGFSDSLLVGYYAKLDGASTVTLQEEELAEATWFCRDDIPVKPNHLSLTNEMIQVFKNGIQNAPSD